ncbi:threonine/serine dehydratase [Hoyosella rhizosphaerae]|uniref:threonine ammonia-lyase n=1 Tax=Hoyosella rhizosphaerae TaxID=1755582 RepID=A0A916U3M6_9ACTN|nr:threonine/serine dehydratase [Hoyosella rhizosphaerae]MBN4926638.1 threonine/serine dehydratase [Hoyosella rhizosphaerae]GGC57638.1 serine/threonine dehydratase [Hoyosella rhizosphaerae]
MTLVTVEDVRKASNRLAPYVVHTPLLRAPRLSTELDLRVLVKPENLQRTGSFKVRGALNTLLSWQESGSLPRGVVCYSAGNHAAAVAYAGQSLGVETVIAMPHGAVQSKIDNVHRFGGEIVETDDLIGTCNSLSAERGFPMLLPFDMPEVIAGQGTVGLEILADAVATGTAVDAVLVPVGGGGLISGIGAVVKSLSPRTLVIGVESEASNALGLALNAGEVVDLPARLPTIADGLAAPRAGGHTLAHAQAYVNCMVEVSESAITRAWRDMVDATKLVVEPSSAVGLAALREISLADMGLRAGMSVVLVASGGNVDFSRFADF